MAVKADF